MPAYEAVHKALLFHDDLARQRLHPEPVGASGVEKVATPVRGPVDATAKLAPLSLATTIAGSSDGTVWDTSKLLADACLQFLINAALFAQSTPNGTASVVGSPRIEEKSAIKAKRIRVLEKSEILSEEELQAVWFVVVQRTFAVN